MRKRIEFAIAPGFDEVFGQKGYLAALHNRAATGDDSMTSTIAAAIRAAHRLIVL